MALTTPKRSAARPGLLKTFLAVSALAAVAAAPLASAASPAGAAPATSASTTAPATPQPGVTAHTVTVGQVDTLSGPVPGLFEGAKYGTEAYFDYVNSHGGVNGRKIKLNAQDDAFSGANYQTETQGLVKNTFALVGGFSLFDNAGVAAINANKIPDITYSLTSSRENDQYNYSPGPIIEGGARLGPLKYYKSHYGDAYQHVGTIDSNVASAVAQSNGVINAAKSIGYKFVYNATVSPFDTNFLPDVLKMQQQGVKMVYVVGLAVNQVADLAQNMHQQGFVPKVFSTNGVGYDSTYIKLAGSAANGTMTDLSAAMYLGQDAKTTPSVALFDKWVHKVNAGAHYDTFAVFGWASAQLFVQALKAAGPNPTRAGVIAQLNRVTNFSANGLLAASNTAEKIPGNCWILVQVVNGHWQRVSPSPKAGFTCKIKGFYLPPTYKKFVRQS
jgi:ABC-type branched-subunit amino acid transport system substrate-binding protein